MTTTNRSLVGDIGGTNARFGLTLDGRLDEASIRVFACKDHPNLIDALQAFLGQHGHPKLGSVCVAVACPAGGESYQFTNSPWHFSKAELAKVTQVTDALVVNDFTAMALGMLAVPDEQQLLVTEGTIDANAARIVVGPGTGLGFSALIPNGNNAWTALATEGGHVGFVPRDDVDFEVLRYLHSRFNKRVSIERLLSGQGLVNIYDALASQTPLKAHNLTPEQITRAALEHDSDIDPGLRDLCKATLSKFFDYLGSYCGDMVLALGARGGVYLCGGILPLLQAQLLSSNFTENFLNKGRYREYLTQVRITLCLAQFPGLLGAATILHGSHRYLK